MSTDLPRTAERPCPVCGFSDRKLLFRQRFRGASEASLLGGYDVVACRSCGLGYADHLPEQAAFDAYYCEMSKYEHQDQGGQLSAYDIRRFADTASLIRSHVAGSGSRILDVGCANGGLLHALRQQGFTDVQGLDPSPVCAETAHRLFGLCVARGTLASAPADLGHFDLVILGVVLEHVRDLASALGQVRRLLSPGGAVYVEVPDASRFTCESDAPFQEFSLEHINFFSPVSLANLMRAAGFEPVFSAQRAALPGAPMATPEVKAMFRRLETWPAPAPEYDTATEPALAAYISRSEDVERRIHEAIAPWVENRRPIIVWGVGTHTQRLMATSRLAQADIRAFVDSNPRYQGKTISGVPVLAPAALKGRLEPILISSRIFQQEIQEQIRNQLGLTNELILLYNVPEDRGRGTRA
jgi:SAM-dependent methyltransferase